MLEQRWITLWVIQRCEHAGVHARARIRACAGGHTGGRLRAGGPEDLSTTSSRSRARVGRGHHEFQAKSVDGFPCYVKIFGVKVKMGRRSPSIDDFS